MTMEARMTNPGRTLPGVGGAIGTMMGAIHGTGVPAGTLELVHLRTSQINGCAFCVDMAAGDLRKGGESDERLAGVAVWREGPWFTDAERAALGLAEAATRLADRPDPVPDEVWDEAARHYDEKALGGLLLQIALTNFFNRVNVSIRQPPGTW
jgi:AhpD family alkylhydroperoxidase